MGRTKAVAKLVAGLAEEIGAAKRDHEKFLEGVKRKAQQLRTMLNNLAAQVEATEGAIVGLDQALALLSKTQDTPKPEKAKATPAANDDPPPAEDPPKEEPPEPPQ